MAEQVARYQGTALRLPSVWTISLGFCLLAASLAVGHSLQQMGGKAGGLAEAAAGVARQIAGHGAITEPAPPARPLESAIARPGKEVFYPLAASASVPAPVLPLTAPPTDESETATTATPEATGDSADDDAAQSLQALLTTVGGGGIDVLAPPPSESDWARLAMAADVSSAAISSRAAALGDDPTTLASWNYADGNRSGHVSVVGSDFDSDNSASLSFNANASVATKPFQFSTALTGDDSGALNWLATSQYSFGKVKLTASGNYGSTLGAVGDTEQVGYGLSASTSLTDQLALNGGINWAHAEASPDDTRGFQGALHLTRQLDSNLKLTGELGVSGTGVDTWATPAEPYGSTGLEWTPGGGSAISASFTDNASGQYSLATALNRQF